MTTNKETAAYVAASITVSLGFKTLLEAVKSWEQVYDAVIEKMGVSEAPTNHAYSPSKTTDGGRKFPITSQEEIQEKIAEVFIQKGRIMTIKDADLPDDAREWATKRGFTHLYDNRWAQKENPKRPAFKAVDDKGNDIKDETGKSISFWGAK
jgi:hypothetical protein